MNENARAAPPASPVALSPGRLTWSVERRELLLFAVATVAVWAHTVDEMRIGEFVAVPFATANVALLGAWPRLRRTWRAWSAIAVGLFWGVTVIPYHVIPLLEGVMTHQNLSGLSRLLGAGVMFALGVAILRGRDTSTGRVPG